MFYKDERFHQQKNRLGRPKEQTEVKKIKIFKNWKQIAQNYLSLSNKFPVSRLTIRRFGCNYPPWL